MSYEQTLPNPPLKTALLKTALLKTALLKTALLKTALLKTALLKTALLKTALLKTALLKTALLKTALLKTALLKTALLETGALRSAVRECFRLLDRTSPDLAARVAELLFLAPRAPFKMPPSKLGKRAAEKAGKQFTFVSGGRRLQAYAWGCRVANETRLSVSERPTVLLIHGWGGHGRQFEALVERLVDAGFGVVSLDLPAHGNSPGRTTNAFEMRRAVLDLVHGGLTELAPFHAVIAHSFGAMVTALALDEGLQAKSCAFVAPMTSFSYAVSAFSAVLGLPPRIRDRMVARLEARFGISGAGMEIAETAGTRTVPLLVVHDNEDTRVPFDLGRTLVEAWPGATLHATSGLGHQRVLADAAVIDRLIQFVRLA